MPGGIGSHGGYPLQYLGVIAPNPPNLIVKRRVPTQNDSRGYNIGDIWIRYRKGFPNVGISSDVFILLGLERDVAHWITFIDGLGLQTLTGDDALIINPDGANNINIFGDAAIGLTTTGNVGANSISISTISGNPIGTDYITDNGTAFPSAAGELHIDTDQANRTCGNTVFFSAAANIVSLSVTDVGGNTTIGIGAGSIGITTGTNNTSLGAFSLNVFTSGRENSGFGAFSLGSVTTGSENSGFGTFSLNSVTSGNNNTGIGYFALSSLTTGNNNSTVGDSSLNSVTTGFNNSSFGYDSLTSGTIAYNNSSFGSGSLQSILTGNDNISIGYLSGVNYVGAESNNILLANQGVAAENTTIRIGTQGTQTRAFIAGVTGVAVPNTTAVVIDSVTGQLGVGAAQGSVCGDNFFFATQAKAGAAIFGNAADPAQQYSMGIVGGTTMTEVSDTDNVFFKGDGAANKASFVAPNNGFYHIFWSFNIGAFFSEGPSPTIQNGGLAFIINGITTSGQSIPPIDSICTATVGFCTNKEHTTSITLSGMLQLNAADIVTFEILLTAPPLSDFRNGIYTTSITLPSGPLILNQSNYIYGYRVA